ncbi:MAG: gluconate 2-dehydrogenase subunit 3 family protein [Ferruginibacter sp.]
MDRRKSLKILAGTVTTTAFLDACKTDDKKTTAVSTPTPFDPKTYTLDRAKEEIERENKLFSETFFSEHEMATIAVLSNIIIPKDEFSGSATDAKVPEFIEFIVKDKPEHQIPMRGGLRWLDMQCLKKYNADFRSSTTAQQIEIVDAIAYPNKVKPAMKQGAVFFSLMRNLTATGFYTSKIGIEDIGYKGNTPNQWNGVPDEVLKQYNLAYTEKELKECISFDK